MFTHVSDLVDKSVRLAYSYIDFKTFASAISKRFECILSIMYFLGFNTTWTCNSGQCISRCVYNTLGVVSYIFNVCYAFFIHIRDVSLILWPWQFRWPRLYRGLPWEFRYHKKIRNYRVTIKVIETMGIPLAMGDHLNSTDHLTKID